MFPRLNRLHAFFFHEKKNVTAPVLVIGYKKLLKFRNLFFRNNQHSSPLRNEIMVCKNHRSAFVSVIENLRFHTVEAQPNGLFVGSQVTFQDVLKVFFDYRLNRYGRDIAGTAYCHRNTTDSAAVLKEALIDQLRNVTQNRDTGTTKAQL